MGDKWYVRIDNDVATTVEYDDNSSDESGSISLEFGELLADFWLFCCLTCELKTDLNDWKNCEGKKGIIRKTNRAMVWTVAKRIEALSQCFDAENKNFQTCINKICIWISWDATDEYFEYTCNSISRFTKNLGLLGSCEFISWMRFKNSFPISYYSSVWKVYFQQFHFHYNHSKNNQKGGYKSFDATCIIFIYIQMKKRKKFTENSFYYDD